MRPPRAFRANMNGGSDQKAMIAAKLRPYYEAQARERYDATVGRPKKDGNKSPEKVPAIKKADSRDEAGRAAGVNGKYVDMATQAKDRQEAGNNQHTKRLVEKIPQAKKSRARDEAGKAAGVNGKYVDMATQVKDRQEAALKQGNKTKHGGKTSIPEKIPESKGKDARDEAGKAAGIISEQSKKNMIHSETPRVGQPPVFAQN